MLLICCGYLCGLHVFYPTKGSLIILTCSWIFLLHFLPSRNPQEILRDFFFFFFFLLLLLNYTQFSGGLNYMQFGHQVCSHLFIFPQWLPTVSVFFILLTPSYSLYSSTSSFFLLCKSFCLLSPSVHISQICKARMESV